jgi:hypothetical protein
MMPILKEMQADRVSDRKVAESMQKLMEENIAMVKEFNVRKPKVCELQSDIRDLQSKVDQHALKTVFNFSRRESCAFFLQ